MHSIPIRLPQYMLRNLAALLPRWSRLSGYMCAYVCMLLLLLLQLLCSHMFAWHTAVTLQAQLHDLPSVEQESSRQKLPRRYCCPKESVRMIWRLILRKSCWTLIACAHMMRGSTLFWLHRLLMRLLPSEARLISKLMRFSSSKIGGLWCQC